MNAKIAMTMAIKIGSVKNADIYVIDRYVIIKIWSK